MAETNKDRTERTERAAEQTFQRAEDSMGNLMHNSRRNMQAVMEFHRSSMTLSYEFARNVQEESLRQTDAWLDHVTRLQKSYFKSWQEYTTRFQDLTEKTVRENQGIMEETVDQGLELVSPGGGRSRRR